MRLKGRNIREAVLSAPNYELVVEMDDRVYEDLEVAVNDALHLVIVKVKGERVG